MTNPHTYKKERNRAIFRERMRGDTVRDIAARHGISACRIYQIVARISRGEPRYGCQECGQTEGCECYKFTPFVAL